MTGPRAAPPQRRQRDRRAAAGMALGVQNEREEALLHVAETAEDAGSEALAPTLAKIASKNPFCRS